MVESWLFEPPRENKIQFENVVVWEIGSKIALFNLVYGNNF